MRFPLFAAAATAVLLGFGNDARAATDPTAELQRYVAETEAAKSSLLKEEYTFELDGEPEPVSVITWKNLDYPRKMSVYFPGEHGATVHEYYYKDPQTAPVLVYLLESITTESVDGADKSTRANQFYFRDGQLIRWTGADRDSFPRTPEDVQAVAHDVLRHRILLSFEAEAAGRTPDELVAPGREVRRSQPPRRQADPARSVQRDHRGLRRDRRG